MREMACKIASYHMSCSCVMAPMLSRGSTAQVDVVPTFAHTKKGMRPASRSEATALANTSGDKAHPLAPVQIRAVLNANYTLVSAAYTVSPLKMGYI